MKRIWIPASIAMSLISVQAMADDCDTIETNKTWKTGFAKLQEAFQQDNYSDVLDYGNGLYGICPRSPALNYYLAKTYEKLGDDSKHLFYLQIATRNTPDFNVEPDVLEQMWTERVFAEHPDLSPVELQKQKEAYEKEVAAKKELQESYNTLLLNYNHTVELNGNAERIFTAEQARYRGLMWSGVGIAVAGIGMTVGGAVWYLKMDNPITTRRAENQNINNSSANPSEIRYEASVSQSYAVTWTLMGAGIATTILGTILTGYAGYQYTHPNSLAVSVVPNGVSISGTF